MGGSSVMQEKFKAKIEELPSMLAWIRRTLAQFPLKAKALHQMELASEEALVNIIRYAYPKMPGNIEIGIHQAPLSHIEIGIRDWGTPFNPLLDAKSTPPLEENKEGGWGIFLLQQLVDDVVYEWDGNSNFLILIKRFSQKL
jgi:serine/threonine-protein kinase RsbW